MSHSTVLLHRNMKKVMEDTKQNTSH